MPFLLEQQCPSDSPYCVFSKTAAGKHMLIQGSATVVQQLTNLGLIDEYHLLVHPVILREDKPLFKGIEARRPLKLAAAKTFDSGVVLLHYQPG